MLEDIAVEVSVDFEDMYTPNVYDFPAKNLLLAILVRAVMDLMIANQDAPNLQYRTQAIRWFLSPAKALKDGFSFLEIVQALNISSTTVKKLIRLARAVQLQNGEYYDLYISYRSRRNRGLRYFN